MRLRWLTNECQKYALNNKQGSLNDKLLPFKSLLFVLLSLLKVSKISETNMLTETVINFKPTALNERSKQARISVKTRKILSRLIRDDSYMYFCILALPSQQTDNRNDN